MDRNQRVIGPDVNHYKTTIGCMARIGVKLPVNYVEFNHVLQHLKDMAWEEKIARKNSVNISKKQCLHRTGKTSFAVMEQEMMMKGTNPSKLDIGLESRYCGKGIEDDGTSDLHTDFTRELSKKSESERNKAFKEEIFKLQWERRNAEN
ncbi:hypothetical protein Salat_1423600 [Sesamum alatum]|uniref:Uncharacterized protein n=1 Tax=Sesamum alatum TaxID=300844 RepID=A0AAE1YA73_9LAMI|nr:hypothetical protein Salat_1423600 [Sesamum alatum]